METPTPTATGTMVPIVGTVTLQVNVRSGPGTVYDSLGLLSIGQAVNIISRNQQGTWYKILYPTGEGGFAWVVAEYVRVDAGVDIPLDSAPVTEGLSGKVTLRINVRSGPSITFDSLGLLEPGTTVTLTGKNATASWYQIVYPQGPDGHGWVTVQFIQTDASADLPVLDEFGRVVAPGATGTPSGPEMIPTPTIGPAPVDGDTSVSPLMKVVFSPNGTRRFTFSGQVSAPDGDGEDWLEFTPFSSTGTNAWLVLSLGCTGNSDLDVELWQNGSSITNWGSLHCGGIGINGIIPAGIPTLVHLRPASGEGLRLVTYTITVENKP
jgi:uncharacterized protein YraI